MKKIALIYLTTAFALTTSVCHPTRLVASDAFPINLSDFERKVHSQNGEDGLLEKVFEVLGSLNDGYFVEFGIESKEEFNARYLRDKFGWNGILIDPNHNDSSINLFKESITAENINEVLKKYNVPADFELLSIDLDYNDFHVWKALADSFKPKVVIIEYNATHQPTEDRVAVYDSQAKWDGTNYFGASLLALSRLGKEKGYSLISTDKKGVNAIFVREDLVPATPPIFKNMNDVTQLYNPPSYASGPRGGHPADTQNRPYFDSAGNAVENTEKNSLTHSTPD